MDRPSQVLDRQGLTGLRREALLAQAGLGGLTRGYRSHLQLLPRKAEGRPEPPLLVPIFEV